MSYRYCLRVRERAVSVIIHDACIHLDMPSQTIMPPSSAPRCFEWQLRVKQEEVALLVDEQCRTTGYVTVRELCLPNMEMWKFYLLNCSQEP